MTDPRLKSLDPELDALLDAERTARPASSALDRVWSRVAADIALPDDSPNRAQRETPGVLSAGHRATTGWLASHALGVATATFVAGAVAGTGFHAVLQKAPVERVVYVDRIAPPLAVPPASPSTTSPRSSSNPVPSPAPPTTLPAPPLSHSGRPAVSTSVASSLPAERALLDDARGALGGGDAARALGLLDEHAHRFPRAQLGEEREALAVQSLVALRRYDEARTRATRFRATAPNSLFLPAIDSSLASIP